MVWRRGREEMYTKNTCKDQSDTTVGVGLALHTDRLDSVPSTTCSLLSTELGVSHGSKPKPKEKDM